MYRRSMLGASVIAALGFVFLPGGALAQHKSLKEQLVGTWTASSWEQTNKDGTKFQRFGANPLGVNVFDANGRFFVMFARPDLPKIATGDPLKATPQENKTLMEGTIAYYGTYTVDEAAKIIMLRPEASSLPNMIGVEQKRTITSITASELKVTNAIATAGGQINYIMKRASTVVLN